MHSTTFKRNQIMKYTLIDDDPIINFVHRKVIKKFDDQADIDEYVSPRKALDDIIQSPDRISGKIVFLDINMPDLNGFEFLDNLLMQEKSMLRRAHVFMLTSSLNVKDRELARKYDALRGFIDKPLNEEKLQLVAGCIKDGTRIEA